MEEKNEILINTQDEIAVVTFLNSSISDTEKISAAAKHIESFISQNQTKKIVFDFSEVKFFCSRVLGMLLEIRSKLNGSGGQVVISAINPQLYRVFKITNLDKIFKFFPDKKSAIESLKTA